ncbi:MAG: hypothetical protein KDK40_03970, partial [Chlamydiia bacterium]|nr:hypothetical protein [Chlamydiia bacterium]
YIENNLSQDSLRKKIYKSSPRSTSKSPNTKVKTQFQTVLSDLLKPRKRPALDLSVNCILDMIKTREKCNIHQSNMSYSPTFLNELFDEILSQSNGESPKKPLQPVEKGTAVGLNRNAFGSVKPKSPKSLQKRTWTENYTPSNVFINIPETPEKVQPEKSPSKFSNRSPEDDKENQVNVTTRIGQPKKLDFSSLGSIVSTGGF